MPRHLDPDSRALPKATTTSPNGSVHHFADSLAGTCAPAAGEELSLRNHAPGDGSALNRLAQPGRSRAALARVGSAPGNVVSQMRAVLCVPSPAASLPVQTNHARTACSFAFSQPRTEVVAACAPPLAACQHSGLECWQAPCRRPCATPSARPAALPLMNACKELRGAAACGLSSRPPFSPEVGLKTPAFPLHHFDVIQRCRPHTCVAVSPGRQHPPAAGRLSAHRFPRPPKPTQLHPSTRPQHQVPFPPLRARGCMARCSCACDLQVQGMVQLNIPRGRRQITTQTASKRFAGCRPLVTHAPYCRHRCEQWPPVLCLLLALLWFTASLPCEQRG